MPTVLLETIIEILRGLNTYLVTTLTDMLLKLGLIEENVDGIKDDTASIDGHASNIETNTDSIDLHTTNIDNNITNTVIPTINSIKVNSDKLPDIDTKAGNILTGLNTLNGTANDIKNNTASVVSPVNRISENVSAIKTNSDSAVSDLGVIKQFIPVISANSGTTAGYTEDTATNTLNIYNKIATISEDTTQLRADNQIIISLLQGGAGSNTDIINLLTNILNELRGTNA